MLHHDVTWVYFAHVFLGFPHRDFLLGRLSCLQELNSSYTLMLNDSMHSHRRNTEIYSTDSAWGGPDLPSPSRPPPPISCRASAPEAACCEVTREFFDSKSSFIEVSLYWIAVNSASL